MLGHHWWYASKSIGTPPQILRIIFQKGMTQFFFFSLQLKFNNL